jgi:hypothetical protein
MLIFIHIHSLTRIHTQDNGTISKQEAADFYKTFCDRYACVCGCGWVCVALIYA